MPWGLYIGKAQRVMEKRINENFAKAGYPFTLHHWILLVHLWMKDGQNQKSLCQFAGRNKSMITRTLDSLEEQNYVLRVPNSQDRRNKLVYLTHKGKQAQEELGNVMLLSMEEASEGIDPDELHICKKVLNQIFNNLADEEMLNRFPHLVPNETISNENISDQPKKS